MTSMNAVMMKFFNLPPAMRMMLAVAGFGSLASIVYFLGGGFLRSKEGRVWILIIGGIGLVVGLTIYLIIRSFRRKKSAELSGALESQGPTRGDIAEQEQIYREKFRAKMAELKANGLSVYRLPWFVLMGEPGCGKTASLIHSGLDFPLGKDEVPGFGGTRNYNWWFSNDAVILDTAGRIAFQEEGTTDKTEWEYFLKLLQRHRPRCPVNGVVVAVPADKLLRDTAEERAQKATVLRERLRQVHQVLGVRFPTFLLVTKMDLVGGFNEFFEEIRVDLQQRSQMFGWSRPGEFQEPYDPAGFVESFDQVYFRLRDWSMRYLQRKATEQELGLVVTFPEALRQLREPLNDYVNTIFQKSPLLEPPFFRGFYFTSAVQEGAPIFDVFARSRPGVTIPERQTRAVDSKAFFIHDFYERKVFAEQGLVFRSAKHVTLNRRMRRIVWGGSIAMLVIMLLLVGFGHFGVSDLVTQPRKDCAAAAEAVKATPAKEAKPGDWVGRIKLAQKLRGHYEKYNRPWAGLRAHSLYVFANIDHPRDDVKMIHARYVMDTILAPIVRETEEKLRSSQELTGHPERYLAALEVYTRWYGEMVGTQGREILDQAEAEMRGRQVGTLLVFLGAAEPDRVAAVTEVTAALESLSAQPRYFAREVLRDTVQVDVGEATGVITAAVDNLRQRWLPVTRLGAQDEFLQYWQGLAEHVSELRARYDELLQLAPSFAQADEFDDAVRRFKVLAAGVEHLGEATEPPPTGSLALAYYELRKYLEETSVPQVNRHITRFSEQLERAVQRWQPEFDVVEGPLKDTAPDEQGDPQSAVYQALDSAEAELLSSYENSLKRLREQLGLKNEEPADYYADVRKLVRLNEVSESNPLFDEAEASIVLIDNPLGCREELKTYLGELSDMMPEEGETFDLGDLRGWLRLLQQSGATTPTGQRLQEWFTAARQKTASPGDDDIKLSSGFFARNCERPFWRPVELYQLAQAVSEGRRQLTVGQLFVRMEAKCQEVSGEARLPGLARLMPGFDDVEPSLPFEYPESAEAEPEETPPPPAETAEPPPEDETGRRRRRRSEAPEPAVEEKPGQPRERRGVRPPLVKYHTRQFLHDTLAAQYDVQQALAAHGDAGARVSAALDHAADTYIDRYFRDWNEVYDTYPVLLDKATLAFLEKCRAGAYDWPHFQQALLDVRNSTTKALGDRAEALVREVVLCLDLFEAGSARDDAGFQRVDSRLRRLGPDLDLVTRLDDLNKAGMELQRGRAAKSLGSRLTQPWTTYLQQVEQVGADARGGTDYPSRRSLRQGFEELFTWQSMQPRDFRLIAPLLDIAEYGEYLLRHHLDRQLAALFAQYGQRYPVVPDARDSSPDFGRLRQLNDSAMGPMDLLKLLRDVGQFERTYGDLYRELREDASDPYRQAPVQCGAWTEFLYGTELHRLDQGAEPTLPDPLGLKWAFSRREGTVSAGSRYSKVEVTLPVLAADTSEPMAPFVADARSGYRGSLPTSAAAALAGDCNQNKWSLFPRGGREYTRPQVRVFEKNPTVRGAPDVTTAWQLPGSPWSLLLLVGADPAKERSARQWIIPVVMETAGERIGFNIAIEFDREFPGPIAPLADPGPPHAMQSANQYLSGPPRVPGSGG